MRIRAGRLRHRLQLQQFAPTTSPQTKNAYGEVTSAWTTQATVWGSIEPLSGREYLSAGGTQNDATVRIVIRYYGSIDESWRVRQVLPTSPETYGKTYGIEAVLDHDERNRVLTLMCSEGANDG